MEDLEHGPVSSSGYESTEFIYRVSFTTSLTDISLELPRTAHSASSEGAQTFRSKKKTQSPQNDPVQNGTAKPEQDSDYISGLALVKVMACVVFVCFLVFLDSAILSTAIPQITTEFKSLGDIGWYGSAYTLASAILQPLTGKIYTHFSSKWSFLGFFLIFELGSLICGAATSSPMLITGRAIAGIGSSGLVNGAQVIIVASVPAERRPFMVGILMGLSQPGMIFGPMIGGVITQYSTWRWIFYINLPAGAIVIILLTFSHAPDQCPKPPFLEALVRLPYYLDLLGFGLCGLASLTLLLALELGRGANFGWNSIPVIVLFVGSGVTTIAFLAWNRLKGDDALIPATLVSKKVVWASTATMAALLGASSVQGYFLPIYFQAVQGKTPSASGISLLPSIVTQVIASVVAGLLMGRWGYYLPWAVIGLAMLSVGFGLLSMLSVNTPTATWIGYQIMVGSGRGLALQSPSIAMQVVLAPDEIAIATAFMSFSQNLASAGVLTVANTIFGVLLDKTLAAIPNLDVNAVIAAGITGLRRILSGDDLQVVLEAYAKSISGTFYLATGVSLVAFCFSWGIGWVDIRDKKKKNNIKKLKRVSVEI